MANLSQGLPVIGQQPAAMAGTEAAETQREFRPDVYWYLSFRCNLACEHCSVFSSPYVDTSNDLGTEDAMSVIEQMVELNVRTAIMSGGEVLFRPDALEILKATVDADLRVGLETNGLLITDEFLDFAVAAQERRKLGIAVSLDGGTPETHDAVRGPNTFKVIVENLYRMKERGVRFDLQCILHRGNYAAIPDLFELGRKLQPALNAIQLGFLNPVGRGTDYIERVGLKGGDMDRIMRLVRKSQEGFDGKVVIKAPPAAIPPQFVGMVYNSSTTVGCMTCQFPLLGILPDGDVTICALSRDNEELCFGNIRERRLKEIWTETRMSMLRSRYVAAENLEGICGDCIWQRSCKGGCRAWAYEAGDSFDAPLPLCSMLVEEGMFPKAYRISEQRRAAGKAPDGSLLAAGEEAGA